MHLYKKNGQPCYEVPYADPRKGMRKTTLKDARKLGLVPSVTTLFDVLDKPGLNRWLQDRVLESALTLPREDNESDKEYMARIKKDSKELSLLARQEGSNIHDAIENVFKGRSVDKKYIDIAMKVQAKVFEYFSTSDGWKSEEYFAHPTGYGGKVDLNNRDIKVVLDFKTKEKFPLDAKGNIKNMAYDEQIMQLVAYSQGLKIGNARHVNAFVDYEGNTVFHEWNDDKGDVTRAYHMFRTILKLWKLQKRYDPIEAI